MDSNHGAVVMAGDLYPNQGNNVGENGNNEEPNEESNNDEANEEVFSADGPLGEGEDAEFLFEAEEAGFYTYNIVFETGQGEVLVDVDRNTKIDFLPYPIGAACIIFGLYKRGLEDDGAIDAELED